MKMSLTKEIYLRNKAIWKTKAQARDTSAFDMLAWLVMADKNILKAFPGVHSAKSLAKIAPQGKHAQHKLERAFGDLYYAMKKAKENNTLVLRQRYDIELKKFVAVEDQTFEVTPEFVDEFLTKFTTYEDLLYPPAIPLPLIQEVVPTELTAIAAAA